MLKGLLTIKLFFLLAMQPVGVAFAMGSDLHIHALPDHSVVSDIECERMTSGDCAVSAQCLTLGHVGCDMNPFQPTVHGSFLSPVKAGFLATNGLSKLPLNETSPLLRPPRHT